MVPGVGVAVGVGDDVEPGDELVVGVGVLPGGVGDPPPPTGGVVPPPPPPPPPQAASDIARAKSDAPISGARCKVFMSLANEFSYTATTVATALQPGTFGQSALRPTSSLKQSEFNSVHRGLRARVNIQLREDPADVVLDGFLGKVEPRADLFVRKPLRNQSDHFRLANR